MSDSDPQTFLELFRDRPVPGATVAAAIAGARPQAGHEVVVGTLDPLSGPLPDACRESLPDLDWPTFFRGLAQLCATPQEVGDGLLLQVRDNQILVTARDGRFVAKPGRKQANRFVPVALTAAGIALAALSASLLAGLLLALGGSHASPAQATPQAAQTATASAPAPSPAATDPAPMHWVVLIPGDNGHLVTAGTHPDTRPTLPKDQQNFDLPADVATGKVSGEVVLQITIDSDGHVTDGHVVTSLSPDADRICLEDFEHARWTPATLHGVPVTVTGPVACSW